MDLLTLVVPCRPSGGKAKGLPAGITLDQLVAEPLPAIPATHDEGNPIMTSEFFDTRQVLAPTLPLIVCVAARQELRVSTMRR